MTDITWVLLLVVWVVVVLYSIIATLIIRKQTTKVDALLNVDTRDPEKDYYDFVLLIPTTEVPKRKTLTVEVHVKTGTVEYYE